MEEMRVGHARGRQMFGHMNEGVSEYIGLSAAHSLNTTVTLNTNLTLTRTPET